MNCACCLPQQATVPELPLRRVRSAFIQVPLWYIYCTVCMVWGRSGLYVRVPTSREALCVCITPCTVCLYTEWHGVLFIHSGPFRESIFKFTLYIPDRYTSLCTSLTITMYIHLALALTMYTSHMCVYEDCCSVCTGQVPPAEAYDEVPLKGLPSIHTL